MGGFASSKGALVRDLTRAKNDCLIGQSSFGEHFKVHAALASALWKGRRSENDHEDLLW